MCKGDGDIYIYMYVYNKFQEQVVQCIITAAAQCHAGKQARRLPCEPSAPTSTLRLVQVEKSLVCVPSFQISVCFSVPLLCSGTVQVASEQRTNSVPVGSICAVVPVVH